MDPDDYVPNLAKLLTDSDAVFPPSVPKDKIARAKARRKAVKGASINADEGGASKQSEATVDESCENVGSPVRKQRPQFASPQNCKGEADSDIEVVDIKVAAKPNSIEDERRHAAVLGKAMLEKHA